MQGRIISPANRPRSYIVGIPTGQVERNQSQLQVVPSAEQSEIEQQAETEMEIEPEHPSRIMTRSRTGTAIYPSTWEIQQMLNWLNY